jgi:retron-type reverse transcriptase
MEDNLLVIQDGMQTGTHTLGPYRKLWVYVPKKRLVMALPYPDRIVQWAIYQYLNPVYDKLFIEDSYACRKDKGSHKAAKRLQYWMRQIDRKPVNNWYVLKLDISKYFYRVNHEKLLQILARRVKDPEMMAFIRGVVNSRAEPFGLPRGKGPTEVAPGEWLYDCGMPIGNLTSQLFANIYLNELDQYCKHKLKIHYYIRYMDDIIVIAPDKETLNRWKAEIQRFLQEELLLDLNEKTSIRPMRQGVEFVGVRIWPTHMKLRKSTVGRLKREVRKIAAQYAAGEICREDMNRRFASIRGLLEHTESTSLRWRLNEIYRAVLLKAAMPKEKEAEREPFADNRGAGSNHGNTGTDNQGAFDTACRAGRC